MQKARTTTPFVGPMGALPFTYMPLLHLTKTTSPASLRRLGITSLFAATWASITLSMHAEVPFARGAFSPTAAVDAEYDSNIFANQFHTSDLHLTLTPAVKFVRDAGTIRVDSQAGVNFQEFVRHHDQRSSDPFAEFAGKLMQEDTSVESSGNAFYRRSSYANPDVNTRTRLEELGGSFMFGQFLTEKLGYRLKLGYNDENFLPVTMSDITTETVNLDARYHYSPKLDAFVQVGKRWSDTYHIPVALPSMDSEDTKFNVGVEGEVLPKVTGQIVAGWVERKFHIATGGTRSGLLFDTSLTWRPDDEMSARLFVTRDFDTTPVDQSVMREVIGIESHRQFREKIGLTLGYSHARSNYIGIGISRHDTADIFLVRVDYSLTPQWKAAVHVNYSNTDSDVVASDYARFVGGVNLSFAF